MGLSIHQLLSGKHFSDKGRCDLSAQGDLDFRPNERMTNLHTKYRVPGLKRSSVIERNHF